MQNIRDKHVVAILFSLALHAVALGLANDYLFGVHASFGEQRNEQTTFVEVLPPPPEPEPQPVNTSPVQDSLGQSWPVDPRVVSAEIKVPVAAPEKKLAFMEAPPPPTAEEWAFAAKYTNKNSKGYRHSWGQQVRSMMGTAFEGADQGMVRFRVEISPDGRLSKLETLWSTSPAAEKLARKAVESMPPLPPTPTGKPLIFEKTISFTPYATEDPPSYRDDCLPDPPTFRNPFAWDGKSPQVRAEAMVQEKLDPQAMEECLRQLPQDSVEAEMARDKRAMDQWGWTR